MNITRMSDGVIKFQCTDPNCGETWHLTLGPDKVPIDTIEVDTDHLGMMYRAAGNDQELVAAIAAATKSRIRS